jgi:hypothetical protein
LSELTALTSINWVSEGIGIDRCHIGFMGSVAVLMIKILHVVGKSLIVDVEK